MNSLTLLRSKYYDGELTKPRDIVWYLIKEISDRYVRTTNKEYDDWYKMKLLETLPDLEPSDLIKPICGTTILGYSLGRESLSDVASQMAGMVDFYKTQISVRYRGRDYMVNPIYHITTKRVFDKIFPNGLEFERMPGINSVLFCDFARTSSIDVHLFVYYLKNCGVCLKEYLPNGKSIMTYCVDELIQTSEEQWKKKIRILSANDYETSHNSLDYNWSVIVAKPKILRFLYDLELIDFDKFMNERMDIVFYGNKDNKKLVSIIMEYWCKGIVSKTNIYGDNLLTIACYSGDMTVIKYIHETIGVKFQSYCAHLTIVKSKTQDYLDVINYMMLKGVDVRSDWRGVGPETSRSVYVKYYKRLIRNGFDDRTLNLLECVGR